jgi:hypothetical protein
MTTGLHSVPKKADHNSVCSTQNHEKASDSRDGSLGELRILFVAIE